MALMLGALMINGITPGPNLIATQPNLFWGLVMSFWVGNVMLLILNVPFISLWVRLLTVPYHLLYPSILMFVCIGAYSVNNSVFDIWIVVLFGFLGYVLRTLAFPIAPLLLGFVLGPMMEEHFRRAMLLSNGQFMTFVTHPISAVVLSLAAMLLLWGLWSALGPRRDGTVTA
jgi:TctA family transporter